MQGGEGHTGTSLKENHRNQQHQNNLHEENRNNGSTTAQKVAEVRVLNFKMSIFQ